MNNSKSIRSRLMALQPGGCLRFQGVKENTLRNTACIIGSLSGKRFKVSKKDDVFSVYRYE